MAGVKVLLRNLPPTLPPDSLPSHLTTSLAGSRWTASLLWCEAGKRRADGSTVPSLACIDARPDGGLPPPDVSALLVGLATCEGRSYSTPEVAPYPRLPKLWIHQFQ